MPKDPRGYTATPRAIEGDLTVLRSSQGLATAIRDALDRARFGGSDTIASHLASQAADEIDRLSMLKHVLLEALEQINDNSTEDNEWDAVDKLHENQQLAEVAIKQAKP